MNEGRDANKLQLARRGPLRYNGVAWMLNGTFRGALFTGTAVTLRTFLKSPSSLHDIAC